MIKFYFSMLMSMFLKKNLKYSNVNRPLDSYSANKIL